jgi:hypothetical protein
MFGARGEINEEKEGGEKFCDTHGAKFSSSKNNNLQD